jgi:predicted O-linked N-acetylglucosamine transferase (SPINDLY family)
MTNPDSLQEKVNFAIKLFSNCEYEASLEYLSKVTRDFPKEKILFNIRGACYAALGAFDDAILSYEKALAIDPNYYKVYFNLGSLYEEIGKLDDAIKNYNCALSINSLYFEALNNLGNIFAKSKKFDQAIQSLKKAINIKPDYLEAHLSLGNIYQKNGELAKAIDCFKSVLEINPDFSEMHNNLGVLFQEVSKLSDAKFHFEKALELKPKFKEANNNLGNILKTMGMLQDAKLYYEQAVSIDSSYVEAFDNLGSVDRELGLLEDAINSYKQAFKIQPINSEREYNFGLLLQDLGRYKEAIVCYQKSLDLKPENSNAYNNLGISFKEINNLDASLRSYEKAISIDSKNFHAYNNLGNIFMDLGKTDKAIDYYKKSLDIDPNFAECHNNLGVVLMNLGNVEKSIACFKKALNCNSNYADAFNNLGIASNLLGELGNSLEYYQKAKKINPSMIEVYSNLGNLLSDFDRLEEAEINYSKAFELEPNDFYNAGSLIHTRSKLCIWDNIKNISEALPSKVQKKLRAVQPFPLLAIVDDPKLHKKAAEIYVNHKFPENFDLPKINIYPRSNRIRIGYFSADFRLHPVANLTAELYETHDRAKFEVYAFSFGPDSNDEMNLRIKSGVDHFYDVRSMSHKDVAILSRSLEIDIAIDLGGFTQDTRTGIFAMRAAPIQVNYLGYSSTMGANYIDYIIADSILIPKKMQECYSEKVVYMPNSFMVNDTKKKISKRKFNRKQAELPDSGFVFCCFNNHYKITPTVFACWMRILTQVENSVLWLSDGNTLAVENLKKEATKHGVNESRIIFAPRLELREDHLVRIQLADLFLDTLPYNAHATTSDALQVKLPVLTHIGKSFASRVAASLINSVNLPELIAETQEQYEEMAIGLAKDTEKLKLVREKLKNNLPLSPLYNTPVYVKQLESAYQEMFERSQNGLEPAHVYVK